MSSPSLFTPVRAGACAAFVATALAGWHLGSEARPEGKTAGTTAPVGKSSARPERHISHGPPEHVRERLASIRGAATPDARMRATIDLATNLPISELQEWLQHSWFDTGAGFDLTLFHKIAMQRWKEEDMEGLIAWSEKNNPGSAYQYLNTWTKEDPERAIAYFRAHPNPTMEMQALATIAQSRPELALARLREMAAGGGVPGGAPGYYYNDQFIRELAKRKPAELESMLDSLPSGLRTSAESALVSQRLTDSFSEGLQDLMNRPDGWKLFERAIRGVANFDEKMIAELPNLPASWKTMIVTNYSSFVNPDSAAKWLEVDLEGMGFSGQNLQNFRYLALQYSSHRDPEDTLKKMAEFDLGEQERRNVVSNIFANLARKPEQAQKMMEFLESDEERKIAQAAIDAQSTSTEQKKVETPAEWLEQAGTISPEQSYQLFSTLGNWDKGKIAELASEFRSMPDEQKRSVANIIAGGGFYGGEGVDRGLQGDAIRYLLSQPKEEPAAEDPTAGRGYPRQDPTQLASVHAVKWSMQDPDAAGAWVQSLPSGDAKLWAQKNLASNWAKYDPDAADQWVGSLPSKERTEVQAYLKKGRKN